ncbi:MAG: DUF3383 domain-containing protein [Spirochaetaceae bacterium]|jgi:hypothetical protein|nr:DUF3383 domain-containing protein [Spirochaetaceae bacterium]
MADQLDNIVKITITRNTSVPAMASFSEHIVVSEFSPVGITPIFDPKHRVRVFGSLDEIVEAGFSSDGYVYRAASKQFSQSPHIGKLYVGWKIPGGVHRAYALANKPFQPGNILHWTVGTVPMPDISFDEEGSSIKMLDTIIKYFNAEFGHQSMMYKVNSLQLAVYGAWEISTMEITGGSDHPDIIWNNDAGQIAAADGSNCVIAQDVNWTAALSACKQENNEWYGVSTSARTMEHQQEVAQWVQANKKLCIITTGDPTVTDEETGDIGAWAKANNLDRVAVLFHPDAKLEDDLADVLSPNDPVPETACFGKMLTKHPGSATWKFKSLQSVPAYDLEQWQVNTIEAKNANWYMNISGIPMISDGRVANGEYIDVIQGIDWLESRVQNLVFTPLVQQDKIPFTDEGIQTLVGGLRAALQEGVMHGILSEFSVEYPTAINVSVTDKAKRILPDLKFEGRLEGAVHRTIIQGTIVL